MARVLGLKKILASNGFVRAKSCSARLQHSSPSIHPSIHPAPSQPYLPPPTVFSQQSDSPNGIQTLDHLLLHLFFSILSHLPQPPPITPSITNGSLLLHPLPPTTLPRQPNSLPRRRLRSPEPAIARPLLARPRRLLRLPRAQRHRGQYPGEGEGGAGVWDRGQRVGEGVCRKLGE